MTTTAGNTASEPSAGSRARDGLRRDLPAIIAAIPLVWLVVVPLAILALSAFKPTGFLLDPGFTLEHFTTAYSDPTLWRLVGRTCG